MANRLRDIQALGQAIWLDNISRQLLDDGDLRRLVEEDGISGVTSNPTIFEKAIGHSERYDEAFRRALDETRDPFEVFLRLAYADIRDACEILRPTFEETKGQDGYVSFVVTPDLARDAERTVEMGKRFQREIDRPNLLIKVPGTVEGVRAFEDLTAEGISVNVTLLFAVSRYEEIAEAYLRGLERRVEAGEPVDRIASVASFFISRVDTMIDAELDEKGHPELKGKAAIANAKLAYESFGRIFSGERWEALKAKGANHQRPLWASTSTKNPEYKATIYVDELIGPDTVNTMPDATIEAAREESVAERTIDRDVDGARKAIADVEAAGVDVQDVVEHRLVDEGLKKFSDSFDDLIGAIERKAGELTPA